jgi:hypothetical protein
MTDAVTVIVKPRLITQEIFSWKYAPVAATPSHELIQFNKHR